MIGYSELRDIAKTVGEPVTNLIALSPQNDPFYAGVANRQEKAEWIAELWHELGVTQMAEVHLRRVHYWLISHERQIAKPDGEPYRNTADDWQLLITATLAARYLGLIDPRQIVERRNPTPVEYAPQRTPKPGVGIQADPDMGSRTIPATLEPPQVYSVGMDPDQANIVELWVEKATVNDVLEPIAKRHRCNLVVGVGEQSETACRAAIDRARRVGKPMRILYISDFDPAGRSMPLAASRKIEYWLHQLGIEHEITVEPIVLLPEQVAAYGLPKQPIKESERRAAGFEETFGHGQVELDALEAICPGELARLTEEAVTRYLDPALDDSTAAAERAIDMQLATIRDVVVAKYADSIERLQRRHKELRDAWITHESEVAELWDEIADAIDREEVEVSREDLPTPEHEQPQAPLFDSRRSYLEQIEHYRAWQNPSEDASDD